VFANVTLVTRMKTEIIKAPDRRVARTQRLLREALHSLIREKDYDAIVIKEILDRADVGRSAFYTHFRDKDELLASSLEDLLLSVPSARASSGTDPIENILWFSLPVLQHVARHHSTGGFKVGPRGRAVLHGHLEKVLAGLILERAKRNIAVRRNKATGIPGDLFARYLASAFVLVLDWWVDNGARLAPEEVNEQFRAMVIPTLRSAASVSR
jgi:AcrR family transcriptional regulator